MIAATHPTLFLLLVHQIRWLLQGRSQALRQLDLVTLCHMSGTQERSNLWL
jgi:hypothetical protein